MSVIFVFRILYGCPFMPFLFFRKTQLQRDLTPYYACDQTEADMMDGVVYATDTSSVDMLCVVANNDVRV